MVEGESMPRAVATEGVERSCARCAEMGAVVAER